MKRVSFLVGALALALAGLTATFYPSAIPQPPRAAFIGDSLTQQLDVGSVIPGANNFGVGGITIEGLRERVPGFQLQRAPLVVMTIGTGNMRAHYQPVKIEADLRAILAEIPGPILWNAVPPSDRGNPEKINRIARRLCAERPNCRWLASPAFVPEDFTDGTHMSAQGKRRWSEHMRAAIR